ncbi:MAG: ABC transporter permease [Anaerolineae bacterium]|nr:ABC transporter permease [Anaerolineae bacterium]
MSTAIHLTLREMWRNRGRFLLFSLVVAMITLLVLFIAALGEGLGSGNREYLQKLDADLLIYQDTAQLTIGASRLERSLLRTIAAVEGVKDVGPIGFSSASIMLPDGEQYDISLIGVEPGKPGEPPVEEGEGLGRRSDDDVIIDRTVALVTGLQVNDQFTLRTTIGSEEEFYTLTVGGITDSRKYGLRGSVFVAYLKWDRVMPRAMVVTDDGELACNIVAVQLDHPAQIEAVRQALYGRITRIDVVDRQTAYENTPGYREQQSTLMTQNGFALVIGALVIGGFFQIQTLQKVPQIGMLKAIGTSNTIVAVAAMIQIILTTVVGIGIGSLITSGVASVFPANIPIVFELRSGAMAAVSLLLMGPIGGLVSIRYSLRVEPLTALGLNS